MGIYAALSPLPTLGVQDVEAKPRVLHLTRKNIRSVTNVQVRIAVEWRRRRAAHVFWGVAPDADPLAAYFPRQQKWS